GDQERPWNPGNARTNCRCSSVALFEREVIVDDQRRMVGKAPVLVDRHGVRLDRDSRCGDLIVDAPADILRPRLAAVRPPRVMPRLLVDAAKYVDETQLVENPGQPCALLRQEAGILLVASPVLEVDRLMRDVPVAAQDDLALLPAELQQMRKKRLKKSEFGGLPVRTRRPRRQIDASDGDLAKIGFEA